MAQVSESTTSLQEAARALQSQSPRQNEPAPADSRETAENGRSDRQAQTEENNAASQTRQTEDRVVISREAVTENRATRADTGARNVDNLRPPSEQRSNERGASQRLTDQAEVTSSGTRINEGQGDPIQLETTPGNNTPEVNTQRNRSENIEPGEEVKVSGNQNTETPLREFQNENETLVEPRKLSKSAEEIEGPREKAEAAKQTVFEIPSQRIIEEVEPSSNTQNARTANINVREDQPESDRQSPSPSSVQTETGQNVDDLI